MPKQLYESLRDVLPGLTMKETRARRQAGYRRARSLRRQRCARKAAAILEWCARDDKPCILVLARPYHMDPGIGHEIEVDLQAHGYPVIWTQYLPTDADLLDWMFGDDIEAGHIKIAARHRRRVAVLVQRQHERDPVGGEVRGADAVDHLRGPAVELRVRHGPADLHAGAADRRASGTLFFSFQDLDSTKPAGSVKIRVETIAHYLEKHFAGIIARRRRRRHRAAR